MNTKANNHKKAKEVLAKFKGYELPEEVRTDEAHLNHIVVMRSVPNMQTMEFDNSAQIVKLNEESLEATKSQFKTLGASEVVTLHDGKQYRKEQKEEADEEAKRVAKEAEENKAKEEALKAEELARKTKEDKAKDERIAELEKQLAKKEAKPETKADAKAEEKK